jgi:hypothetical protein
MQKKISALLAIIGLVLASLLATPPKPAKASVSNWQKGATVQPRWNTDFDSPSFRQSIDNLASTKANYVALMVPWYQSNLYSTDIGAGWNTPTDASLVSGINYIHSKGMKILLIPHVDSYTGEWRANINPSDRNTWFTNYGNLLNHLAQIAQQTGADELSVGAELISMSTNTSNPDNTQRWINLINQVRATYSGKLTYSANWGDPGGFVDEKAHINFWPQLDFVGISAYYNLRQAPDNSVPALENAWNSWLNSDIAAFANSVNKPILFTEIGYKSVTGSHNQPWDYNWSGPADQNEQANDYTALFDFWDKQSFMQGVFFWDWSSDPNAGGAGDTGYTPQNKQAQSVMTQWFSGTGTSGGGSPSANPYPTVSCPGPASNAFTGCYFSDQVLGNSAMTRTDQNINFDWGNGSFAPNMPTDHFSARWTGNFSFNAGGYTFSMTSDDGSRLYIDNQLVLDKWIDQPATTYTAAKTLTAGSHEIKMEYYENGGGAVAKLSWTQGSGTSTNPPAGTACPKPSLNAFTGCYYTDQTLTSLALIRTDQSINFDWGGGSPDPAIPVDHFSVRWQGNFQFNAGDYTFSATGDDGIRVLIDGIPIIDQFHDQPATTYTATKTMTAGTHQITIEYYENGGNAVAKVSWVQGNSSTPTPPPPTPNPNPQPTTSVVLINGYPTINSNYIDCNGNIDNDPVHHTTNSADTDPGHHIGQNCPAGSFVATH